MVRYAGGKAMLENSESLNNQAIKLASNGDYTEAIACFMRAINIEKENYLLWFNLALTYRDAGDIKDARKAIQNAFYMNPTDEEVIETLATICYESSDIAAAFEYAMMGLSLNGDNYRLWNTLGVLYFNQDEYETASEAFENALVVNPYYYDALYNLRDCYEELGNAAGAQVCSERMKGLAKRG